MTAVLIILILLASGTFCDITINIQNCTYYWTLYDGQVPANAVPGGRLPSKEVFYIGLVQLKLINEIFTGMIIPSTRTARITSLGVTREVKNDAFTVVNILCSDYVDGFQWVNTTSESLSLVPKNDLVEGGKVLGQDLYIGRVHEQNSDATVLGKVFPHGFIYQGLYVPSDKNFGHLMSYEVLVFRC